MTRFVLHKRKSKLKVKNKIGVKVMTQSFQIIPTNGVNINTFVEEKANQ